MSDQNQDIRAIQKQVISNMEKAFMIDFANGENIDEFVRLVKEARKLAESIDYQYGKARAMIGEGIMYYMQNNMLGSISGMKMAIDIFEKEGDFKHQAITMTFMGLGYWGVGDFSKAFDSSLKALQIFEQIVNEPDEMTFTLYMLGSHYLDLKDYENAEKHFQRAINLKVLPEQRSFMYERRLARNLIGLSNVMNTRQEYDKALEMLSQALDLQELNKDTNGISRTYNDMAKTYQLLNNTPQALEFFGKSLELRRSNYDKQALLTTLLDLSELYIEQKNYETASNYLEEAKEMAEKIGAKHKLSRTHQLLSNFYKLQGNFEKSLAHFETFYQLKEQVQGTDTNLKIRQLQTRFEIENKEKEAEIYRLRNVELKKLNEEIETKNKNILDSINYAQRIQQAILPLPEQMSRSLPEHFVFFKPRDIVSGDFYFFAEIPDKLALAAVDCTGHGVPGAFMSMIGNEILNETISMHDLWETDKILDELNKGIQKALKQQENANRDGMDMSLVVLERNPEKGNFKKISFSGAKNPMLLIQNGILEIWEADRSSIGRGIGKKEPFFTKKERNLEENLNQEIVFYLFSDGYQDQFGGAEKRKFMSKRFREMLFEISYMPMSAQKEALTLHLQNWTEMGKEKQVDDILVIGVRLKPNSSNL